MSKNTNKKDNKNKNKEKLKLKTKKTRKDDEKEEESSKLKNLVDTYMKKEGSFSLKEQKDKYKENEKDNKNKGMDSQGVVEKVEDNEVDVDTHEDKSEYNDDRDSVVIFIGNVPLTIQNKSDLVKKLQLDPKIIQSVHFRSLPVDPKYSYNKKVAIIKKRFSDAKDSQNAYVKLKDSKYVEQLLEKNTMEVDGHHLFINANNNDSFSKFSRKKTIFVGRLPPSTNEDELYNIFMNVSPVKGVRIVRDPKTMRSKGFGFVAFDNRLAVSQAIKEFNNTKFKGYTLNVSKCLDEKSLKGAKKGFGKKKGLGFSKNKTNFKMKKFH